eukprot:scaffold4118_cov257-Pinguiococcus_pyrenoidosus.AAC.2
MGRNNVVVHCMAGETTWPNGSHKESIQCPMRGRNGTSQPSRIKIRRDSLACIMCLSSKLAPSAEFETKLPVIPCASSRACQEPIPQIRNMPVTKFAFDSSIRWIVLHFHLPLIVIAVSICVCSAIPGPIGTAFEPRRPMPVAAIFNLGRSSRREAVRTNMKAFEHSVVASQVLSLPGPLRWRGYPRFPPPLLSFLRARRRVGCAWARASRHFDAWLSRYLR